MVKERLTRGKAVRGGGVLFLGPPPPLVDPLLGEVPPLGALPPVVLLIHQDIKLRRVKSMPTDHVRLAIVVPSITMSDKMEDRYIRNKVTEPTVRLVLPCVPSLAAIKRNYHSTTSPRFIPYPLKKWSMERLIGIN